MRELKSPFDLGLKWEWEPHPLMWLQARRGMQGPGMESLQMLDERNLSPLCPQGPSPGLFLIFYCCAGGSSRSLGFCLLSVTALADIVLCPYLRSISSAKS